MTCKLCCIVPDCPVTLSISLGLVLTGALEEVTRACSIRLLRVGYGGRRVATVLWTLCDLLLVGILLKGWESDLEALKTRGVLIELRPRRIGMWRLRD